MTDARDRIVRRVGCNNKCFIQKKSMKYVVIILLDNEIEDQNEVKTMIDRGKGQGAAFKEYRRVYIIQTQYGVWTGYSGYVCIPNKEALNKSNRLVLWCWMVVRDGGNKKKTTMVGC
jgi:hypothetical protein